MNVVEQLMRQRRADKEKRRKARSKTYAFALYKFREEVPETPLRGKHIPKPRSGHRIVHHDGLVYCFGGYNPNVEDSDADLQGDLFWEASRPLFKELWRYNVFSKKWRKLSMDLLVPDQLASHTAVVHGQRMLVYGGTGAPFGQTTSNTVFEFDLDMGCWGELHATAESAEASEDGDENGDDALMSADMPRPLYGQAVIVDGNNLYTVGGTSGFQYYMDVHRLNLVTKKWQCLYNRIERNPAPRYRHELCFYKNQIIVLGGGTSFESNDFEQLAAFNVETRSWSFIQTKPDASVPIEESYREQFPEGRRCHSCVQDGQYVFMFGGFDGEVIMRYTWRLDLETMRWHRLPHRTPKPVYFHASTMTEEGKVITFGGVNHIDTNSRTNHMFSCWVKIPKLRDMCWEALNHYYPDLDSRNVPELIAEGVPRDLLKKLHCGHL